MDISFMFLILLWESMQTAIGKISGLKIEITCRFMAIIIGTVIYETRRMMKFKA